MSAVEIDYSVDYQIEWAPMYEQPVHPQVIIVPEMVEDKLARKQAQRVIRFAGSTVLNSELASVEELTALSENQNLQTAIQRATTGNVEARQLITTNVAKDVIERTVKTGHVMEVEITVDDSGKLLQFGQHLDTVQANSLRYVSEGWQMQERTEAETRNNARLEQHNRQGLLDDYYFVVFSRCADNMSENEMTKAGFFTDTMSCAIQATHATDEGLVVQSAFVAGVKRPGQERHDAETIVELARTLGVDYSDKTAAQIIATPLLIHKSLMPYGVIDMVEWYDTAAGGTFFGEDRPRQNYFDYLQLCKEREGTLRPTVNTITEQLISEATSITTPLAAIARLHELSQQYTLSRAIEDKTINPRVFGAVAAAYIEQARLHHEIGNKELAFVAEQRAQKTAQSSSCPTGRQRETEAETAAETLSSKNCDYISKECPLCHKKNVRTHETKTKIECKTCKGFVRKTA